MHPGGPGGSNPSRSAMEKKEWGDGPWQSEPDRVEWRSQKGLPCLIVRGSVGALCGYVGVPKGHPAYGKDRDDVNVRVHGGLTYDGPCSGHVCHVPNEGESDDIWWLGFDTGHAFDLCPAHLAIMKRIEEKIEKDLGPLPIDAPRMTYRDIAYVTAEVNDLASQLEAMC